LSDTPTTASSPKGGERLLNWGAWIIAFAVLGFAIYLGWQAQSRSKSSPSAALAAVKEATPQEPSDQNIVAVLPEFHQAGDVEAILPEASLHTNIPTRPRYEVITHTVETGDSVFGIAQAYGIKPETVLWGNYDVLNDNPDQLSLGMQLKIPPVDGVLYEWKEGDSIQGVSESFEADKDEILSWPGNEIDLTDPEIDPGTFVMLPGGHREFRQWLIPTIPRGAAGVSNSVLGAGACPGGYEGAFGTGAFIWPAYNHYLSGNDYWSGHLAIDIAAGEGSPIYAADSGVVVFAGPAVGGYGNMVMIDHGNGYQTLYAHLSSVNTGCGRSVLQGQTIAYSGNTGNSTGPHLHFEVRYLGGFVNPWFVLPAP